MLFFLLLYWFLRFFPGCDEPANNNNNTGGEESHVQGVGSVDQSSILSLPAFQKAEEDFMEMRKEKVDEYSEMMEGELTDKQKEIIYREFEDELAQIRFALISPLMDKEKEIIENIAKEKKLSVVLDETLVVYGVEDITGEVSKAFEAENATEEKEDEAKEEEKPEENKEEKNDNTDVVQLVGYISKDKISELPKMRKADDKYYEEYVKMQKQIQIETKDLKDQEEIAKIINSYQEKLQEKREELFKPIEDEINKAAEEISDEKGLL